MRTFRHPALALLVLATFSPTLAWGQAEKVGIVTTLEGNVTTKRAVLPLPVPLKFKDDVFFRDTITTGDQSLARVLLGGKSIVTVRERSVVTITESPGRSFISLESGKIGLAVARERMAPGESVDVRTPNAVVGVRGTVIVAEVTCPVVRTEACPAAATNLFMLRGSGEVRQLDPTTGVQIGPPVTLNAMQQFKAAGTTAQVTPISPSQVGQINAGLEGKGIQHKEAANQEQVKGQVTEATAAVLGALTRGAVVEVPVVRVVSPPGDRPTSFVVPTIPPTSPPVAPTSPSTVPSNITIDPALAPFAAAMATAPTPVVMIPAGVAALTIPGSAFEVETTTPVPANLDRPLFQATGANLTMGGNLLNVLGSLSSTSSLPVLSPDPTTITTGGDFIRIAPGASVSVNSSLVSDTGGTLTAGGSFVSVEGGGSLTSTGASPVVQLNNTNVSTAGPLIKISGGSLMNGSLVKASGGMLTASGLGSFGRNTAGGPPIWEPNFGPQVLGCDDCTRSIALGFSFPFQGRTFTSAELSSNAFLSLGGSNGDGCCTPFLRGFSSGFLDGAARISVLWDDPDPRFGNGVRFNTFAGRAVVTWDHVPEFFGRGNNTYQIQLLSDGRIVFGYMSASQVGHSVLVGVTPGDGVRDPGSVDFSSAVPFSTGAVGTVYELFQRNTFDLTGTNLIFTPDGLGGWFVSTSLGAGFITIADGAVVTQTGGAPLVELISTRVTANGAFVVLSGGSHLTLGGQLLSATDSPLTLAGGLLQMTGGSQLTSASASSLVSISGGVHSIATAADTAMLDVEGSTLSFTGAGPVVDVLGGASITGGPFFRATAATLTVGSGTLLSLADRSSLTTGGPVLDLMNTTLDLGTKGTIVNLSGGSHLTTRAGPFARISGGALTTDSLIRTDGAGNTINLTGGFLDLSNNARVTLRQLGEDPEVSTSAFSLTLPLNAPFIRMAGSTLTTTGLNANLVDFDNDLPDRTTPGTALIATAGSTVNLSGSLFRIQDVTSMATAPLVQLTNTTINQTLTARPLIFVNPNGETTTLTGQLLTAIDSNIATSGSLAESRTGRLVSNTAGPLMSFQRSSPDGASTVTSAGNLVLVGGLNLNLHGSLLSATDTAFNATNPQSSAFAVIDGANVTTTGTSAPLLQFSSAAPGLPVTAARNFLALATTSPGQPSPSMTLSGPLLEASVTHFATGNPAANTFTFLFVGDSATLTGPAAPVGSDAPALVTFTNSSLTSAGDFLTVRRSKDPSTTLNPSRVILHGPLLAAVNSSFTTFSNAHPSGQCCSFVFVGEGGQLTDTGTTALLQFSNSVFPNIGGSFVNVTDSAGLADSVSRPALLSPAGPLLQDLGGRYTINGAVLRIRNGSEVDSKSANPLLSFSNSAVNAPLNGNMSLLNQGSINAAVNGGFGPGDPRNTTLLSLAGGLVSATNTPFDTGTFSTFVGVRDGATVRSTSVDPFISLNRSPVRASGVFFTASQFTTDNNNNLITGSRAPITVSLNGPLLSAQSSDISAIFGLVSIGDNASFTSTTGDFLIRLAASNVSAGGVHPFTQQAVLSRLFTLFDGNGLRPNLTLSGPLFSSSGVMNISTTGDVFGIFRSPFHSSTLNALLDIGGTSTVQAGQTFFIATGFPGGTNVPPSAASVPTPVNFGGPLLVASDSVINTHGNFLNFTFGADVGHGAGNAFVDLRRTNMTTTAGSGPGHFLELCCGTPAATLTFQGSLLASDDSHVTLAGALANITDGATLVTNSNPAGIPLVSLNGSSLNVGTGNSPAHVFNLVGRSGNAVPDLDADPVTGRSTGLLIGQDQPIQHGGGGVLFETSNGATVNVSGSIHRQVDAQLLAATIPALVNLMNATQATTGSHAVDLGVNSKVQLNDLIRLTNSTMTVGNGMNIAHLVNIDKGRANITGNLVTLANNTGAAVGSTLNILNGVLLNLMNGAVANIGNALVSFQGLNNTINVTNTFRPTNFISGIPIFVASGATFNFAISETPLQGLGQNNNRISINGMQLQPGATGGVTGSLVAVQGTGGTLKVGQTPAPGASGTIVQPGAR